MTYEIQEINPAPVKWNDGETDRYLAVVNHMNGAEHVTASHVFVTTTDQTAAQAEVDAALS